MDANWSLTKWVPPSPPQRSLAAEINYRVSFLQKQSDFECLMLAEFGMTVKTIAKQTRLSVNQVMYRLKRAGIKTTTFREGKGPFAQMVMEGLKQRAARQLTSEIRVIEDRQNGEHQGR